MAVGFSETFIKKHDFYNDEGFLWLTLLPTEKCNFRCAYCYENFKMGKMSDSIVSAIEKLLTYRAPKLKLLVISWFGGEPTLNLKVVIRISTHIIKLQNKYNFKYSSSMTTNGYLLNANKLESLIKVGVNSYQISLDGDKNYHDKTRVTASGHPTFDTIWNNLLSFKELKIPFDVLLRVHRTANNKKSVDILLDRVNTDLLDDFRFRLNKQDIKDLGSWVNVEKVFLPEKEQDLTSKVFNKGQEINPYICYASIPNHYMIRSSGRVGKCTVDLYQEKNDIGNICADGRLNIDNLKHDIWKKGYAVKDRKYMACPSSVIKNNSDSIQNIKILDTVTLS